MFTTQQNAQCVLWYHKLKSPTAVQRKFSKKVGQDPPHTNSIKRRFKNFMKTGSILDRKRSARPMFHTLSQTYAILAYFNNKITCKKITKKLYGGIIHYRKFKVFLPYAVFEILIF